MSNEPVPESLPLAIPAARPIVNPSDWKDDDYWSSLDPLDPAQQMMLFNARLGEVDKLSGSINLEFDIEHILLHPIEVEGKEGEVLTLARAVIITPKGDMLGSVSGGVMRSLKLFCKMWGQPPWRPARRVKVIQMEIKGGKRMFLLQPVVMEVKPNAEKKK